VTARSRREMAARALRRGVRLSQAAPSAALAQPRSQGPQQLVTSSRRVNKKLATSAAIAAEQEATVPTTKKSTTTKGRTRKSITRAKSQSTPSVSAATRRKAAGAKNGGGKGASKATAAKRGSGKQGGSQGAKRNGKPAAAKKPAVEVPKVTDAQMNEFLRKHATDKPDAPAKGLPFVDDKSGEVKLRLDSFAKFLKVDETTARKAIEVMGGHRKPFSYQHPTKGQTSASYYHVPGKAAWVKGVAQRPNGARRAEGKASPATSRTGAGRKSSSTRARRGASAASKKGSRSRAKR
jgi:hypothetical protein